MALIEQNENGLVYMASTLLPARHAFTTRFGGVSEGDYASLNLGTNRGDVRARVDENYRRVCALVGAGVNDCAITNQVHGAEVRIVRDSDRHVRGTDTPYEADGLVTAVPGLPLVCFVADCVPVLLCDGAHGVVGAIHCGWRSSVGDILGVAVEKMQSLGAETGSLCAAIGPSIGACCFETDGDVPAAIERWLGGDTAGLFAHRADGKTLVDLRAANARRLMQLGLPREQIDLSDECTVCRHDKYWSHRYTSRHGLRRGSQAALIVL